MSYVIPLGEDSWKLAPNFFQILPHMPLPFAVLCLYPFAVINHSHEYESCDSYTLSPGSPPSKSLSPRVVLGTPNRVAKFSSMKRE